MSLVSSLATMGVGFIITAVGLFTLPLGFPFYIGLLGWWTIVVAIMLDEAAHR